MFEDAFGKRLGPPLFTVSFTIALVVLLGGGTLAIIHGFKDKLRSLVPPTTQEIAAAVVKALPQASTSSSADEIASAVIKALPKQARDQGIGTGAIGQAMIGGVPGESILEQPSIDWDGKSAFVFHARVARSGEKLPVYLDSGIGLLVGTSTVNNAAYTAGRLEIGFLERLAPRQIVSVTIGSIIYNATKAPELQWGEPHYNHPKVTLWPIGSNAIMARVVIIRNDGKEERYPFFVLPHAPLVAGDPPSIPPAFVIGPSALDMALR